MQHNREVVLVVVGGIWTELIVLKAHSAADDKITGLKAILGNNCSSHPHSLVQIQTQLELACPLKYQCQSQTSLLISSSTWNRM